MLCYQGFCLKCIKGWTLNSLEKKCYSISGDSLIVGDE